MRKPEPVDEYAETEVLVQAQDQPDADTDALSLYAEYESGLAHDAGKTGEPRARR